MTAGSTDTTPAYADHDDVLAVARSQVLEQGVGLTEHLLVAVLRLPDEQCADVTGGLIAELRVLFGAGSIM